MDAGQIDATAAHLATLGLLPHQVERHVRNLTALAALRAKREPEKPRKRKAVLTTRLTEAQILALLPKLREREWRWANTRPGGDDGSWVGHAIAAVTGQRLTSRSFKATNIVGDALRQLCGLGLIKRVPAKSAAGRTVHVVNVVRSYRVRLHGPGPAPQCRA